MHPATSKYAPQEMQYHLFHFILLTVFSGFATTTVVLRIWARKIKSKVLELNDYLIMLGLVSIVEVL